MQPIAVDFETYYDAQYSLKLMSPWAYVFDARFHAYLVSIYSDDIQFVGRPEKFDWASIAGRDLLMHNAGFDALVLRRLVRDGKIPEVSFGKIFDTADCAAYCGSLRNLAAAAKCFLGVTLSKATRAAMLGKTERQADAEGMREELNTYAARDAKTCWDLWQAIGPMWPEPEREVSRLTRERGWQGFRVDVPKLDREISKLRMLRHDAGRSIPWEWDEGKTPLSHAKVRLQCRAAGIPAPASFAQNDEACQIWEDQYAKQFPWIEAIRVWRRTNMLSQKLETLSRGVREDGTFPFAMMYFGAATGRWSGRGAKFNLQNLPRDPESMFQVDLRSMLLPDIGHKWVIADFAQIEARLLLWAVKDTASLALVRAGCSVYEAHARASMGWDGGALDKESPKLYSLAKARVLGLGFGCGGVKFQTLARMFGVELTLQESTEASSAYRKANPKIVAFWQRMDRWFAESAIRLMKRHLVVLPSGRRLSYWEPRFSGREKSAMFQHGANRKKAYGGLLTENYIQALARDVLVDRWLEAERQGIPVRFTVHDEMVVSAPAAQAEEVAAKLAAIMSEPPSWLPGCPMDAKVTVSDTYTK